ncbi:MAG TPA: cobyric acid synthase [Solirubrobacterales bacterium]|jgi:adenosylcobyric acid synthase|nr:cobyric acid synthase [Solirubrobacterales bacterium]
MTALMIQGTSSWAGKSLLTTALARILTRRGVRLAPFKAVNMSNNARAVEGGEIGVAQYLQARAAGVEPDVRMNPVLIKPEADMQSQVVLLGKVDHELSRTDWRDRAEHLRPAIERSLRSLQGEYDVILAEGAGSPAEINLYDIDLANMHVARQADAQVLLVADINRGGAFAHLFGTWSLVAPADRERIAGFILNRFRGDASLLAPGPQQLEEMTGVPLAGVVPWLRHALPDEDGVSLPAPSAAEGAPRVAVIRYPAASNLDEFKPLEQAAQVSWAGRPSDLEGADLVVMPGSKHVASDLEWLRSSRLDYAIAKRIAAGGRVLAVCGGLQMLGGGVADPTGVEGAAVGLGFLPIETSLASEKRVERTSTRFAQLSEPWSGLSGLPVSGYEIRHGASTASEDAIAAGLTEALPEGLGFASGPLLGVYLHGLFENPAVIERLIGVPAPRDLDSVLDELANLVEPHLDMTLVESLIAR